jgi:putative transposase
VIHAIPGNPHGKGWIERFFRTVRDDFLKLWRPQFYCGDDMAKEALDKTCREIKAGRLQLPTLAEFTEDFNKWLATYVQRKHPEDNAQGKTIAEMWAGLVPVKPHHSLAELKRQRALVSVRRARIVHDKREYTHTDLYAFNGQTVVLEYDLEDDRVGIVRTQVGVWICDAHLVSVIDVIAPSRMEEKSKRRLEGQIKRGEKKIAEQKARAGRVFDAEAVAEGGMEALEGDYERLEVDTPRLPDSGGDTFSLDDFND